MKEKDEIKELFKEALSNHETSVRPELWNSISSQIGSTAAASSSAVAIKSIIIKSLIGVSVASIAVVSYIYITNPENSLKPKKQTPILIKEDPKKKEVVISEKRIEQEIIKKEISVNKKKESEQRLKVIGCCPDTIVIEEPKEKLIQSNLSEKEINQDTKTTTQEKLNNTSQAEEDIVVGGVPEPQQESPEETLETPQNTNNTEVITENEIQEQELKIVLPNVFTPNGDGSNDYLMLELKNLSEFSVVVLDMNSKVVFKSEKTNFRWNGNLMNGDPAPSGNYVYYITAKGPSGELIQKHSTLRINR